MRNRPKWRFDTMVGLASVRRKRIRSTRASSISDVFVALTKHRACNAANDCGAINVWRDDDGRYRANFNHYLRVIDEQAFASETALLRWLVAWWPRMKDYGGKS